MSAQYVIHWSDARWNGQRHYDGPLAEAAVIADIMAGSLDGQVDKVDRYDTDEHTADNITEDIAISIARHYVIGDLIRPDLADFIEKHAGLQYTRGLRRDERTFAAA